MTTENEMPIYTRDFFDDSNRKSENSARIIFQLLRDSIPGFPSKTVVDFGCGLGEWLRVAVELLGTERPMGVDGDWVPKEKLFIPVKGFVTHDLTTPFKLASKADLALSLEVAEHLEECHSDAFIRNIADSTDLVLFSAAIPWQGGVHHVNEQWPEYWATKFRCHGFTIFDGLRMHLWNNKNVSLHYRQNIFLCARNEMVDVLNRAKILYPTDCLNALVHPDLFTDHMKRLDSFACCLQSTVRAGRNAVSKRIGRSRARE